MPSTKNRLSSAVLDSSMVTTPWRPTLAIASEMSLPISGLLPARVGWRGLVEGLAEGLGV